MELSKALRSALERLSRPGAELTYEKGGGYWIEFHRISPVLANKMLRLCLIKVVHGSIDKYCVFAITTDGRKVLEDLDHVPEIVAAIKNARSR